VGEEKEKRGTSVFQAGGEGGKKRLPKSSAERAGILYKTFTEKKASAASTASGKQGGERRRPPTRNASTACWVNFPRTDAAKKKKKKKKGE